MGVLSHPWPCPAGLGIEAGKPLLLGRFVSNHSTSHWVFGDLLFGVASSQGFCAVPAVCSELMGKLGQQGTH